MKNAANRWFGIGIVCLLTVLPIGCGQSYQAEEAARKEVAAQEELRKTQVAEEAAANAEIQNEKTRR